MFKWLMIPIVIFFVVRGCKTQIEKGIPTGADTYIENAQAEINKTKNKNQTKNKGGRMIEKRLVRFLAWIPGEKLVILETGERL